MPSTHATFHEWPGGLSWLAHPDEPMQRASHALVADGAVWIVEPLDADGVDEALGDLGEVAGVVVLLDRHIRDAAAFAARYDVSVYVPDVLTAPEDDLGGAVEWFDDVLADTGYRTTAVVIGRVWREAVLVSPDGSTVIVPEAIGTNAFYTTPAERAGVHALLRGWPPRRQLGDLAPERLLVGHGAPVLDDGGEALGDALAGARRRAPRALGGAVLEWLWK